LCLTYADIMYSDSKIEKANTEKVGVEKASSGGKAKSIISLLTKKSSTKPPVPTSSTSSTLPTPAKKSSSILSKRSLSKPEISSSKDTSAKKSFFTTRKPSKVETKEEQVWYTPRVLCIHAMNGVCTATNPQNSMLQKKWRIWLYILLQTNQLTTTKRPIV
jgi:hypothetical protein